MKPDVNRVLKVYLGTDENGGYQPLHRDERMRQAFPESYSRMMELIAPYLDEDPAPDRSNGTPDLNREAGRFAASLRRKFPELDDVTIKALAARWCFGWSR